MSSHRRLRDAMTAYRIGDPAGEFPIWDAGGARLVDGRWHEAGASIVYASERYATAMLEKLVHYAGTLPRGQHFVEIHVPAGISYEVLNPDTLPGWAQAGGEIARAFGDRWYREQRSALLIVPSVVARMERNFLFHSRHPDFSSIRVGEETPVWWDDRLFDR